MWKEALSNNSDIICVQETHFSADAAPSCTHRNFPYVYTAKAHNKTKGVLTAIRDSVAFTLHDTIEDPRGRYLILICDLTSITYTIVNVYTPNQHQVHFLHKILRITKKHQRGRVIICGDFNATPDPSLDSSSGTRRLTPSLSTIFHSQDLYDAWRCMHAGERDYTFFSSPHRVYSRIDLFLVDQGTLSQVTSTTINTITWSDHASITLSLNDDSMCNIPHMWRLNTYLMQQPDFKNIISKNLSKFFSINASSVQDHFVLYAVSLSNWGLELRGNGNNA